ERPFSIEIPDTTDGRQRTNSGQRRLKGFKFVQNNDTAKVLSRNLISTASAAQSESLHRSNSGKQRNPILTFTQANQTTELQRTESDQKIAKAPDIEEKTCCSLMTIGVVAWITITLGLFGTTFGLANKIDGVLTKVDGV